MPTRISVTIDMPIWLLHTETTPRCSQQRGCVTLPQSVQPWVAASSSAWLDSAALAWLSINIASRPSLPSSIITNMTRQPHHQHDSASTLHHGQVTAAAPSPTWLGIDITPWPSCLGSAITSMTRQRHRQYDSTTASRYIQHHFGSAIVSMARQCHHVMAWLSTSTTYDFGDRQTRCQLIPVLLTNILGSRANASIPLRGLAPPWCIYIWRIHTLKTLSCTLPN
jgi:hypothetical protein